MIINPSNQMAVVQGLFTDFAVQWRSGYDSQEVFADKFASTLPSGTEQNAYAWMDHLMDGGLREWVGERVFENLVVRDYVLANKLFERSIRVKRTKIADDQYGIYGQQSNELGRQSRAWADRQLATLIEAAHTSTVTAFDGQPMFSTAHPINIEDGSVGTYSNYDASGKTLNAVNLAAAITAMEKIKGRDGNPLGIRARVLMVPPALRFVAAQILATTLNAPATALGMNAANTVQENVLKGVADYFVNPYLTDDAAWYLIDDTKGVRPFIFQLREAAEFQYLVSPTDYNVFLRDDYLMGVRARGGFGVSLPFLAYKGKA